MQLTREAILGLSDIGTEVVEVPEWGGSVKVRGLTGRQRDEFEAGLMERRGRRLYPNTANIRAKLVAWSVVNDDGTPMFTHADIEALGEKSAVPVSRIYEVASRLSGLSDEDVEELAGNFGSPDGKPSSSTSPNGSTRRSKNS